MITLGAGWDQVDRKFRELAEALGGDDQYEVSEAGAEVILRYAVELAPVDTGELRDSGDIVRDGNDALAGFSAEHAEPVEYGTSKMAAQPYVRPARDGHSREAADAMGKVIRAKVERVANG